MSNCCSDNYMNITYQGDCNSRCKTPCYTNSNYVTYVGSALPNTGINTNDTLTVAIQKIDNALSDVNIVNAIIAGVNSDPTLQSMFCNLVALCLP